MFHIRTSLPACGLFAAMLLGCMRPALAQEIAVEPRDAAAAADAVMQAARERAEADERAAGNQLIRDSRILFPQRAGAFELQRSARDPESNKGVVMVYRYNGDMDTDFEIRAWPLGGMPADKALDLGTRRRPSCMNLQIGAEVTQAGFASWKRRMLRLPDGRELEARQRRCENMNSQGGRVVYHSLLTYRDLYVIELDLAAGALQAQHRAQLVSKAAADLLPRIHVQNVGNCMPPARPESILVDAIDSGSDHVSHDGARIYVTRKTGQRELAKLQQTATERRRNTSCVASFSPASLLPDEKFETLRFPAGSFAIHRPNAPAGNTEK